MRAALEKVADGKPVEALHLTDVVLTSDPKNPGALKARIKALGSLQEDENFVENGWLTYGITTAEETPAWRWKLAALSRGIVGLARTAEWRCATQSQ